MELLFCCIWVSWNFHKYHYCGFWMRLRSWRASRPTWYTNLKQQNFEKNRDSEPYWIWSACVKEEAFYLPCPALAWVAYPSQASLIGHVEETTHSGKLWSEYHLKNSSWIINNTYESMFCLQRFLKYMSHPTETKAV